MKLVLPFLLISFFAFADDGKTLVRCGNDVAESTYFELRENGESFEFEFRETVREVSQSVTFGLKNIEALDGHRYQIHFEIPKKYEIGASHPTPSCFFSPSDPRLFSCLANLPKTEISVRDMETSKTFQVGFSSFHIFNVSSRRERVVGWEDLESKDSLVLNTDISKSDGTTRRALEIGECKASAP